MRERSRLLNNAILIAEVRARAKELKFSKAQFRREAGGVPLTFQNIITGKHNPNLKQFIHVVHALGGQVKIEWDDKQT